MCWLCAATHDLLHKAYKETRSQLAVYIQDKYRNDAMEIIKKDIGAEAFFRIVYSNDTIDQLRLQKILVQLISERTVLYVCNNALPIIQEVEKRSKVARSNSKLNGLKEKETEELHDIDRVILAHWMIENPWYRVAVVLGQSWPKGIPRDRRVVLVNKLRGSFSAVNRRLSLPRPRKRLSRNSVDQLVRRAKIEFEERLEWLLSFQNMPRVLLAPYEDDCDENNSLDEFTGLLLWLRHEFRA